jgi:4-amino-4-deoxy-L-arabinose transferase-like glycosyltransferase
MTLLDRLLSTRRPALLLLLFCLLAGLPGFFSIPPTDRDESRFAQATRQMTETGDYITIMNGSVARNAKPIGIYWLQAPFVLAARAAAVARGNPIWPYRIPSALGGLLAVLACWGFGRRLVGERAALLAGLMLAACVIVEMETRIAKTDAALLGVTTLAMGLLARAYLAPAALRARGAAIFWLAVGAGILLKGPITPMVAALAAVVLAVWDRRVGWMGALRPKWGVPLMLAVVLPWFVAIGIATHGRFFSDSVGGDLGRKLASGDDAHWGPPGLHLLLLPLLAFPATVPVLRGLGASFAQVRRRAAPPATRFLLAWAVPSWLVMEAVPTKLPHYTLPLYPALMLLGAAWLLDPGLRIGGTRWLAWLSRGLFVLAGAVTGVAALVLPPLLGVAWWLGIPALLAAALVVWLGLRHGPPAALLAVPLLYWAVLQGVLPNLRPVWIAPAVAAALDAHLPAPTGFGAVSFHEPSLMFLAGTQTQLLGTGADAADYLAAAPGRVVALGERDRASFRAAAQRDGLAPEAFAEVRGFNYSNGHWITLTLFDAGGQGSRDRPRAASSSR